MASAGCGEHQHELIADLLEDPAPMLSCEASHSDAEPSQYFGGHAISHRRGQRGKAGQIDKEYCRVFLARRSRQRSSRLGKMAEQVFAVGALIRPPVEIYTMVGSIRSSSGLPTSSLAASSSGPVSPCARKRSWT